jgi:hypothetical protein
MSDTNVRITQGTNQVVTISKTSPNVSIASSSQGGGETIVNGLQGIIRISGENGTVVYNNGQTIVINGQTGVLFNLITGLITGGSNGAAAGVLSLNSLTGNVTITGIGGTVVSLNGQNVQISGGATVDLSPYATVLNLASTGSSLQGQVDTLNTATGQLYPRYNPSGFITSSGLLRSGDLHVYNDSNLTPKNSGTWNTYFAGYFTTNIVPTLKNNDLVVINDSEYKKATRGADARIMVYHTGTFVPTKAGKIYPWQIVTGTYNAQPFYLQKVRPATWITNGYQPIRLGSTAYVGGGNLDYRTGYIIKPKSQSPLWYLNVIHAPVSVGGLAHSTIALKFPNSYKNIQAATVKMNFNMSSGNTTRIDVFNSGLAGNIIFTITGTNYDFVEEHTFLFLNQGSGSSPGIRTYGWVLWD